MEVALEGFAEGIYDFLEVGGAVVGYGGHDGVI